MATQTLGGGVFSGKYLFERNQWDRVSALSIVFLCLLFVFLLFCSPGCHRTFITGAFRRMRSFDLALACPPRPSAMPMSAPDCCGHAFSRAHQPQPSSPFGASHTC